MRLGLIPENLFDRVANALGMAPPPAMTEAYSPLFARAIVAATETGMFDAIASGSRSAAAVAAACGTDTRATERLLNLLVTMRYLRYRDGEYRLSKATARWMLREGEESIRDFVLMKRLEWSWIDGLEEHLRSGKPLDVHGTSRAALDRALRAHTLATARLTGRYERKRKSAVHTT